jgi:cyclopropane fatty-acyl-phospholipid synthase-like methyltransferase
MIPVEFELMDTDAESELQERIGPPGKWAKIRDVQLDQLSQLGLKPDMKLVDLGCGTLRVGLQLIAYLDQGNYVGIDIDPGTIKAGNELVQEFGLTAKSPHVLHSATFGEGELEEVEFADRIWCFQVMIHMSRSTVHECMAGIRRMLKPDGKAWVNVRQTEEGPDFEVTGKWRFLPISRGRAEFFQAAAKAAGLNCRELRRLGKPGASMARNGAHKVLLELTRADKGATV